VGPEDLASSISKSRPNTSRGAPEIARILMKDCGQDSFGHVIADRVVAIVTISALLTNIGEDVSHMARTTCDILVETAKWILSLAIVIELERLPKGRPTHRRMAVFTRSGKRPVRIARSCGFAHLCGEQAPGR